VRELLGSLTTAHAHADTIEFVAIPWQDATKSRLRCVGDQGTDVAIDLPRGSFLKHLDVLGEVDRRVVAVSRPKEPMLVVRPATLAQAAAVGHAFGNQHVPIEVAGEEIWVPITTTVEIAVAVAEKVGVEHDLAQLRPFSYSRPLVGHSH
jgi:urease accessory protein